MKEDGHLFKKGEGDVLFENLSFTLQGCCSYSPCEKKHQQFL